MKLSLKKSAIAVLCLIGFALYVYAQSSSPPQPGWFPTVSQSGITVWTRDGGNLTNLQVTAGSGAAGLTNDQTFSGANTFTQPPVGSGASLTNLTYRYNTNAIPTTGVLGFGGNAYRTNLQADIVLPAFANVSPVGYESIIILATNSTAADHTITMPSGVVGTPGMGVPAVVWCTNKVVTKIVVDHYARDNTNVWKIDVAP